MEDHKSIGELLAGFLDMNGYATHLTRNVEEAISYLGEHTPNLVLLDLTLPGTLSADYLVREIKREYAHEVPVILISGRDDVDEQLISLTEAFLNKPFDLNDLLDVVNIYSKV